MEDDRGLRYLGSEETFQLGVGVIFLLIDQYVSKGKNLFKTFLIILLTAIILFTKNRAALLSLFLGFGIVMVLEGKAKIILKAAFGVAVLMVLSFLMFPALTQSVITPILNAFNVTEDETGSWRLLIQAVAIQQAMQTPILGQGFGGYFSYYVEQIDQVINYPPHSMYIYLFQKTGIIGLLSYLAALFAMIRECSALRKVTKANATGERYRLLLKVLIITQLLYGFAYNFSIYLGFYVGMLIVLKKIKMEVKQQDEQVRAIT
jgi:O-antigen ligase